MTNPEEKDVSMNKMREERGQRAVARVRERMEVARPYESVWSDDFLAIDYLMKLTASAPKQLTEDEAVEILSKTYAEETWGMPDETDVFGMNDGSKLSDGYKDRIRVAYRALLKAMEKKDE